jgi:hypothetical protein
MRVEEKGERENEAALTPERSDLVVYRRQS